MPLAGNQLALAYWTALLQRRTEQGLNSVGSACVDSICLQSVAEELALRQGSLAAVIVELASLHAQEWS
jgi:hypothetical protein